MAGVVGVSMRPRADIFICTPAHPIGVRPAAAPDARSSFAAWLNTTDGNVVVRGEKVGTYAPLAMPDLAVSEAGDVVAPPARDRSPGPPGRRG